MMSQNNLNTADEICGVDRDTEIFTANGWKKFDKLVDGEMVFSLDVNTRCILIHPVVKIEIPHSGTMYQIRNKQTINMCVGLNHKILIWNRYDQVEYKTVKEIIRLNSINDSALNHSHVERGGIWTGEEPTHFCVPHSDIIVLMETWVKYFGIYLAEGWARGTKGGKGYGNAVSIKQNEGERADTIRSIMNMMPFKHRINRHMEKGLIFTIANKPLHDYMFQFGDSHHKFIPPEIKALSPRLLNILLDHMLMGDGKNRHHDIRYRHKGALMREYCTVSDRLADDVCEIMLKIGGGGSVSYRIGDEYGEYYIEGRKIKYTTSLKIIHEHTANGGFLNAKYVHVDPISYSGPLYRAITPSGNFLMRRNFKTCWIGS